ncbi:MAG: type II toxin-antitoxin system RatA family toxin [Alphaproteobacteria bacterium]|nr:type II toxin-antitoxin system RatA family toxin [Alphaproteobacteria bacterium]
MPSHSEQRELPFTPDQLFDLVADIGKYPEFLPWCVGARILDQKDNEIRAELAIGYKGIRERFTSLVTLDRPNRRIRVRYIEGPFKYLENNWVFEPLEAKGCRLDFHVDFEFRSRLMESLIGRFFGEAVRRMVQAFETRAGTLYDPVSR